MMAFTAQAKTQSAIFAGGCFWCVESNFDKIKGVTETISGYAGGTMKNPTYHNHEGNQEAVKVSFDPDVVSYDTLGAHLLAFNRCGGCWRPVLRSWRCLYFGDLRHG